jgi:NitT/TauT family transport system ATP-binding protein
MQEDLAALWQTDTARTTVFVTHSMDEAVYLSDRIVLMDTRPGRIQEVIDVDLPRPRDPGLRRTTKFVDATDYLWERLAGRQPEPRAGEVG